MTSPVVQRLRDAAASMTADRVSIDALLKAHGPTAEGSLLLMLAVPCMLPIPGTGTLLGMGLVALAVAMWRGQFPATLPARVGAFQMSRGCAQRVLSTLATIYALASRVARARVSWLEPEAARRWLAPSVAAMAVLIVLPIPFGNILPALALVLVGLGLVFRDGLVIALGLLASAFTACLMIGLAVLAAYWGHDLAGRLLPV